MVGEARFGILRPFSLAADLIVATLLKNLIAASIKRYKPQPLIFS